MKAKYWICLLLTPALTLFDQRTKTLILERFREGESWTIVPGFFNITRVHNDGAVFGLLHSAPGFFRTPFFLVVPLVAIGLVLSMLRRLDDSQRSAAAALALILSGAMGNLIDRFRRGFVVDFLDFHWRGGFRWPAFNVADYCLVLGILVLITQALPVTSGNSSKKAPPSSTP